MRPKKDDADRRKNRCIRFTDSEWQEAEGLAKAAGFHSSTAAYVRRSSLRPLQAPRIASGDVNELIRQIRKIGVNLNQLTRLAHAGRSDIEDDLRRLLNEINEAVGRIR